MAKIKAIIIHDYNPLVKPYLQEHYETHESESMYSQGKIPLGYAKEIYSEE
ncbi:9545_t:CDS:2 [Funneliformis geosporum]|nr:9545_t:CDS:2 [Funneliformis geosporum]